MILAECRSLVTVHALVGYLALTFPDMKCELTLLPSHDYQVSGRLPWGNEADATSRAEKQIAQVAKAYVAGRGDPW